MENLTIIEKDGLVLVNSVEVAGMVEKEHKNLMRDIRRIIEREGNIKNEFIESTYVNSQNKLQPCYLLTEIGKERLINKYKYRAMSPSLEKDFEKMLRIFFPNEPIITQHEILNYRVDFYMPELSIVIEYDEKEHIYKQEEDAKRQREIQEFLKKDYLEENDDNVVLRADASKFFPFLRVKEGFEIEGLRELLFLIQDKTFSDVLMYMK